MVPGLGDQRQIGRQRIVVAGTGGDLVGIGIGELVGGRRLARRRLAGVGRLGVGIDGRRAPAGQQRGRRRDRPLEQRERDRAQLMVLRDRADAIAAPLDRGFYDWYWSKMAPPAEA